MRSTGVDSYMWLSWDLDMPIDASVYRNLCIRMNLSQASQGEAIWYDQNERPFSSGQFLTLPGWQQYQFALNSYPTWTGLLRRLRFDPVFASNIQIEIDSIKLTNPAQAGYTVKWIAGGSPEAKVSIFYNTTGSTQAGTLLASNLSASYGKAEIDTSCFEPGEYYIVVQIEDGIGPPQRSVSPGRLMILRDPQGVFVSPSAITLMAERGGAPAVQQITIDAYGLPQEWQATISQDIPWLSLSPLSGIGVPATLTLTAEPGANAPISNYSLTLDLTVGGNSSTAIPVQVLVVDQIYSSHLPLVRRH